MPAVVAVGEEGKTDEGQWEGELNDGEVDLLLAVAGGGYRAEAELGESVPVEYSYEDGADDCDGEGDDMLEICLKPSICIRKHILFLMDLCTESTA